ncbi:MAG: 23S rRNA (uracil(1939)-C(5))-methyltransferase RlmD [Pseudomonadota bacterium]
MASLNKNRKLTQADILSMSHEGRGVAKVNGKTTFIHNALESERVMFYYTHKKRNFNQGHAVEITDPSPQRVAPICPHYELCGGCNLQHWQHQQQIIHKQAVLAEHLRHFAASTPAQWLPPIIGPTSAYRHKARLGVRHVPGKGDVLVGFRERNGRYITDITSCAILHPSVGEKIVPLRQLISQLSLRNEIAQIEVAVGDKRSALIFRHLAAFSDDDLQKLSAFAQTHCFDIYLQPGKPNTIHKFYPKDNHPERLSMSLETHGIEILFHPADFTQINPSINKKMIAQALSLLELNKQHCVLDLFCGIGNFSLVLAKYAGQVTGVEVSDDMVKRAYENARHNQLENVAFYQADLNKEIHHHTWARQSYDAILLDPPRSGAAALLEHIEPFKAAKIVYVSCHPATLARDTAILIKKGYQLKKAGIMDMFPHTAHVESIALFEKQ